MLVKKPYDWNLCMMELAFTISKMSKDPATKVGAVVVSPDKSRITVGYNGFPRQIPDFKVWWENRGEEEGMTKYDIVRHAEINAMTQAKTDLEGWFLYVTHFPCLNCARDILSEGIKKVFYFFGPEEIHMAIPIWKIKKLFETAEVELKQLEI